jgi:hypothetical protein
MIQQAENNQATPRTLSPNNLIRTLRLVDTHFIAHLDSLIAQNVPAGDLCIELIRFIINNSYHEMALDTILYPIMYPFVGATQSPKKVLL